jgi:hypothetical protein
VKCQVGDLTGSARVRIVPPLPWAFDFNEGTQVPLTWIGGRVRWQVRNDAQGNRYLAKLTKLPTPANPENKLGTRSFIWMGPIDLSNYTIQGDVLLTEKGGRISDVGLINGRYQLTIRASNKKLRLDTWTTSDYRAHADTEFVPEPNVWYTLKLSVAPASDGTTATARGKIWRRGDKEPDNWTVEFVDPIPNLAGTPGIFGKTEEAEVYLDNVLVTPN